MLVCSSSFNNKESTITFLRCIYFYQYCSFILLTFFQLGFIIQLSVKLTGFIFGAQSKEYSMVDSSVGAEEILVPIDGVVGLICALDRGFA